ncbi:MAG: hypothetical protein H0U53_05965 [Actinobacteria bacterium]|nr:hypothetical protein [Actinomycetota bacterium]
MARDNKLTKSIGEHFVCSVLAQVGWAASLTRDGIARTDVLAIHSETGAMIQVQVKTSSTWNRPSWHLGEIELAKQPNEWFVLVVLGRTETERPRCFVVPRDHLAAAVWMGHNWWLHEPGIPKGQRNASMDRARLGADMFAGYEERWELLEGKSVPVLLETKWHKRMKEKPIGLPPRHPWLTQPPTSWPGPAED